MSIVVDPNHELMHKRIEEQIGVLLENQSKIIAALEEVATQGDVLRLEAKLDEVLEWIRDQQ
jgi:hypothetical protein